MGTCLEVENRIAFVRRRAGIIKLGEAQDSGETFSNCLSGYEQMIHLIFCFHRV